MRVKTISKGSVCEMSINKFRGFLYTLSKVLGDVNAVKKGKIGSRVARRITGKISGRLLGKLHK